MASPYNILIEGDSPSDNLRVHTQDDGIIFYCESDSRMVNRNITIYIDENFNFIYDVGEELGSCSYTVETMPDLSPPQFIAPPDIEIACGTDTSPNNAGDILILEDNCPTGVSEGVFFTDAENVEDGITTIIRSWAAADPCGNTSETQLQIITINCTPVCNVTLPKITCGN